MKVQHKFVFAAEEESADFVSIQYTDCYSMDRGYGFKQATSLSTNEDLRLSLPGEYVQPAVPTLLVDVPYGNYRVSICFGDQEKSTETTVLTSIGSLMLDRIQTLPGQFLEEEFAVHVDDGQLKLAFAGQSPSVRSIAINRDASIRTMFLIGDSTVTDQPAGKYPYTGWGQGIGQFFTADIAVVNYARSGASSKSFMEQDRYLKVQSRLRSSDYVIIQFAHNDEKDNDGGTEPYSSYQQFLREYINSARSCGAVPLLVTPMHRRVFDERGEIQDTHGQYSEAMRKLAADEGVTLLDLAAKSKQLFEASGEEGTKEIFLWAEPGAYPTLPSGAADNTHFSRHGGMEIARLVADCVRDSAFLPLARFLRDR